MKMVFAVYPSLDIDNNYLSINNCTMMKNKYSLQKTLF